MTEARLTSLARETLESGTASLRVTSVARETLASGQATLRVTSLVRETLIPGVSATIKDDGFISIIW